MKDKEKQIFDKYGNYDFPTDIKQESLNSATTQIEEMNNIIRNEYKQWLDIAGAIPYGTTYYAECLGCAIDSAEALYAAGYRKVFSNKDNFTDLLNEEIKELSLIERTRKETAKEILILLGKGFDETKMTEFKNLPWYKSFCKELKHRYDIEVEE